MTVAEIMMVPRVRIDLSGVLSGEAEGVDGSLMRSLNPHNPYGAQDFESGIMLLINNRLQQQTQI